MRINKTRGRQSKRNRSEHFAATKQWDKLHGQVSNRQQRRALAAQQRKDGQEKPTEK